MASVSRIAFNNGYSIPNVGLGTWMSKPGEVRQAVVDALSCGYRHIDSAHCYENEDEVGQGISQKIEDGTVKREDVFVTSKLWVTMYRQDLALPALKDSLKKLKLDYLDLYLLHWPFAFKEESGNFPKDDNGAFMFSDVDFMVPWRELEKAQEMGLVRSIGVSNFNEKQLERVCTEGKVTPVTNQIECHPYLNQRSMIDFCEKRNIRLSAYSPLGSPARPSYTAEAPAIMADPLVQSLAKKYGKNSGQILIRYQVQRGVIVLPKSVTKQRIESNLQVFDFEFQEEEMKALENMKRQLRYIAFAPAASHPMYPF